MVIERRTVLKALRSEPLMRGFFFEINGNVKNCKVCAVGAVVRNSLSKAYLNKYSRSVGLLDYSGGDQILSNYCEILTQDNYIDGDVDQLLKEKNYLGALSNYFESQRTDNDENKRRKVSKREREKLINFVKKNFPVRFRVKSFKSFQGEF